MIFEKYAKEAAKTANYSQKDLLEALSYLGLGLTGEAGEFANKLKKVLRGDIQLDENGQIPIAYTGQLLDELGDVLWYLSECARQLGASLDIVAFRNICKLERRLKNGTISGEGDVR